MWNLWKWHRFLSAIGGGDRFGFLRMFSIPENLSDIDDYTAFIMFQMFYAPPGLVEVVGIYFIATFETPFLWKTRSSRMTPESNPSSTLSPFTGPRQDVCQWSQTAGCLTVNSMHGISIHTHCFLELLRSDVIATTCVIVAFLTYLEFTGFVPQ
ncbi:hypothetical protein J6590_027933 [Homalodisca vitripennis]|nr:hypothetical protein J6590_027933 [Homalodisca vitripennis]